MAFAFSLNVGYFCEDKSVLKSEQFDIKIFDSNPNPIPTMFNYEVSINPNDNKTNLVSRHCLASLSLNEKSLGELYSKQDYYFHFNQLLLFNLRFFSSFFI
jgi:hypothetical protein